MNYIDIIYNDTGNARGISTTLFVSGCTNNCAECHNPQSHDFSAGSPFTKEIENQIIKSLQKPYIKNFVISGGDPCHPNNINTIKLLVNRIHKETNVKVILYTGYDLNKEKKTMDFLLSFLKKGDLIIDGPYLKDKKTKIRDYRGSTNQRAILVNNNNNTTILNDYFLEDLQV